MLLRFEDGGKVRITFLNELGDDAKWYEGDASLCEVIQHLYEYSERCNLEVTNWWPNGGSNDVEEVRMTPERNTKMKRSDTALIRDETKLYEVNLCERVRNRCKRRTEARTELWTMGDFLYFDERYINYFIYNKRWWREKQ